MDSMSNKSEGKKSASGKNSQSIKTLQDELKQKEELLLDVKALIFDYQGTLSALLSLHQ